MHTVLLVFEFLGTTELLVIAVVALILFGPRKLPEIGRTVGKGLAEFRRASDDFKRTWEYEVELEQRKPALGAAADGAQTARAEEVGAEAAADGAGAEEVFENAPADGPGAQTVARGSSDADEPAEGAAAVSSEDAAWDPAEGVADAPAPRAEHAPRAEEDGGKDS